MCVGGGGRTPHCSIPHTATPTPQAERPAPPPPPHHQEDSASPAPSLAASWRGGLAARAFTRRDGSSGAIAPVPPRGGRLQFGRRARGRCACSTRPAKRECPRCARREAAVGSPRRPPPRVRALCPRRGRALFGAPPHPLPCPAAHAPPLIIPTTYFIHACPPAHGLEMRALVNEPSGRTQDSVRRR